MEGRCGELADQAVHETYLRPDSAQLAADDVNAYLMEYLNQGWTKGGGFARPVEVGSEKWRVAFGTAKPETLPTRHKVQWDKKFDRWSRRCEVVQRPVRQAKQHAA